MKRKGIGIVALILMALVLFSSCVTQPRFSDYIGLEKSEALQDLNKQKSSNTVKLILNWLIWGPFGLWIPSIVDTVNYVSYMDDFRTIEHRIDATPDGGLVGK